MTTIQNDQKYRGIPVMLIRRNCIYRHMMLNSHIVSSFHTVDKQHCFQDGFVFYQFSSDECADAVCEFGRDKGWQMGVRLLKQLAPLAPLTSNICDV